MNKKIKKAQLDDEMMEQLEDLGLADDIPEWMSYEFSGGSGSTNDYITLSSCPIAEDCEQLGPNYNPKKAAQELRVYKEQLERQFPKNGDFPGKLAVKYFNHDFGRYGEVVAYYNTDNEDSVDWAYNIENELPEYWDEIAKSELQERQPDGTGPHGRGMGPGKGRADGTGIEKKESKTINKNIKIAKSIKSHMNGKKTIASKKVMSKIASSLKQRGFQAPFKISSVILKTAADLSDEDKKTA